MCRAYCVEGGSSTCALWCRSVLNGPLLLSCPALHVQVLGVRLSQLSIERGANSRVRNLTVENQTPEEVRAV